MQHKYGFDKDDLDVSQSRITTGLTYRYRNVVALCLAVMFLGFGLFACGIAPSCGSNSLNSACTLPSQPTVANPPTTTALKPSTPYSLQQRQLRVQLFLYSLIRSRLQKM